MYDDFSSNYDRFVNWPGRLAAELPFIERQLQAVEARRVLDAACGTGRHARLCDCWRGFERAHDRTGERERGRRPSGRSL